MLICDVCDPITREKYSRDPRHIAKKAEAYLKQTGIGDTSYFGPEAEFFVFNSARFHTATNEGFYHIDSNEGIWNAGSVEGGANLAYKTRHKQGYFPAPPTDTQQDLRTEMCLEMAKLGILIETQHHEVATAGQAEIDMKFDSLTTMADNLMKYKHVVKNVARRHGMTATFMPKPLYQDNGSGMHVHQSIWKDGKPLFAGDGYAGLSKTALYYIGGILKHARALAALTNPGHQLLQAAGAGLRGAGEPGLLEPQPLGGVPHPDLLGEPEGEARGGPLPGSLLQRVPRLRGDADGRHRRHREQDRSGWTARQEHLRPLRRGGEACSADAGEPERGAHASSSRTTSSC